MAPPGLSMVSVSAAAWEARTSATAPRYYFDWERTREAQEKLDAAFTPAVSIVIGLDVALGLILERGLDAAFEQHVRLGRACREGVKAMGLDLFSPDDDSSAVVTAVRVPEPVDGAQFLLDAARPLRDHACSGPGPAEGQGLPHRPHRLLRRLRHHHRARRARARRWPRRARTSSAASPSRARSRRTSTPGVTKPGPDPGADRRGGRRAPARALRRRRGHERRPRRARSATTTRSSSARRRSSTPS